MRLDSIYVGTNNLAVLRRIRTQDREVLQPHPCKLRPRRRVKNPPDLEINTGYLTLRIRSHSLPERDRIEHPHIIQITRHAVDTANDTSAHDRSDNHGGLLHPVYRARNRLTTHEILELCKDVFVTASGHRICHFHHRTSMVVRPLDFRAIQTSSNSIKSST